LLGNAVKFTEHSSVTLRVSVVSSLWSVAGDNRQLATDNGQRTMDEIRFEVSDTGIGMRADDLPRLFHHFEQVGDGRRRAEGTGLGLAIRARLIQHMGSVIRVESRLGKGSVFWFDRQKSN